MVAGLHTPVMPLVDVVGKVGTLLPEQMSMVVPKSNTGVRIGLTVTINVAGARHSPGMGSGVNV